MQLQERLHDANGYGESLDRCGESRQIFSLPGAGDRVGKVAGRESAAAQPGHDEGLDLQSATASAAEPVSE